MSAIHLADLLRRRVAEKLEEHHQQMDKGQSTERYNHLVGRNQQLAEMRGWINEALDTVDSQEGEDTL